MRESRLLQDRGNAYYHVSVEQIEAEEKREGRLAIPEIIWCQVRYFCDGTIFGSLEFVNGIFEANRWRYAPNAE